MRRPERSSEGAEVLSINKDECTVFHRLLCPTVQRRKETEAEAKLQQCGSV